MASLRSCSAPESSLMEHEPLQEPSSLDSKSSDEVGLLSLPVEIHSQILSYLDVMDVLSYARVCKSFRKMTDCSQLWKRQWIKLSSKTPFAFIGVIHLSDFGVNFKDSCKRLWRVLVNETSEFGELTPSKCVHCREYTCLESCIESCGMTNRVALDIGGKITWFVTTNYELKRHLSMIAVPKTLRCYDCDTTFRRSDYLCDCEPKDINTAAALYCRNRQMSSHTALEYCSQPLADIWRPRAEFSQPFCLFCEDDIVHRMLCERDMVSSTKLKMKGVPSYVSSEEFNYSSSSVTEPLTNGYCRDTASILDAHNLDLVSPLLAMEHEEAFPIVKAFLSHLLKQYKMIDALQKPNSSFILTEPGKLPLTVKEELLKFLFEEAKVSRVCLLPKALALSKLFDIKTCIVVDSGATSTSVWVVVDDKVDETKTQTVSVGGWHVSQFLKQALTWKDHKEAAEATISSLDTSAVKQKCRLSLNLNRENDGASIHRTRQETLHIKSQKDAQRRLELTEVTLSSELYLAPEMMYASLDLPAMVNEATKDLPKHLVKDCFSQILITGGNTDLQGFSQRFASDLRELLPEHSPIIDVKPYPTGNHSWNTVMGANAIIAPSSLDNLLQLHEPGCALWMSREEYITFGFQRLASHDPDIREG